MSPTLAAARSRQAPRPSIPLLADAFEEATGGQLPVVVTFNAAR